MIPFRLYFLDGCKHCEKAIAFLTAQQVPFQRVEISGDPIAAKGIKAALDTEITPVFVAFQSKEIIKGFNADAYSRLVSAYRSPSKPNVDTRSEQDNGVAKEETLQAQ